MKMSLQGAPGFEPGTSRSAVECSTTELYPLGNMKVLVKIEHWYLQVVLQSSNRTQLFFVERKLS